MNYATAQQVFGADAFKGNTFIGLDTETVVPLKGGKSNPMKDKVTKRVTRSKVQIFGNVHQNGYGNMVARRLVAEGKDPEEFELGQLKWGTRVPGSAFIEHKGSYYVQVIFQESGSVEYFYNGQMIEKDKIIGLDEKEPRDDSQGGLEKKVIVRSYKLDSIKEARAHGTVWR